MVTAMASPSWNAADSSWARKPDCYRWKYWTHQTVLQIARPLDKSKRANLVLRACFDESYHNLSRSSRINHPVRRKNKQGYITVRLMQYWGFRRHSGWVSLYQALPSVRGVKPNSNSSWERRNQHRSEQENHAERCTTNFTVLGPQEISWIPLKVIFTHPH